MYMYMYMYIHVTQDYPLLVLMYMYLHSLFKTVSLLLHCLQSLLKLKSEKYSINKYGCASAYDNDYYVHVYT